MKPGAKWALVGLGVFMTYQTIRRRAVVNSLRYFKPSEFQGYAYLLSPDLLLKLDEFRHRLGAPVRISPDPGGVMRQGEGTSQHYFGRAVDIILPAGVTLANAFDVAKAVGFTGIGLYRAPTWGAGINGMHLDVRPSIGGHVATWSGWRTETGGLDYRPAQEALNYA